MGHDMLYTSITHFPQNAYSFGALSVQLLFERLGYIFVYANTHTSWLDK